MIDDHGKDEKALEKHSGEISSSETFILLQEFRGDADMEVPKTGKSWSSANLLG